MNADGGSLDYGGGNMIGRFHWWEITAGVLVALWLVMAGQNLASGATRDGLMTLAIAAVLVAGLAVRHYARLAGGALVFVGALPGFLVWWTIIGPVCAAATILGLARHLMAGGSPRRRHRRATL